MTPTRYAGARVEEIVARHSDKSRQRFDDPDTDVGGLDLGGALLIVVLLVILGLAFGFIHTPG